MGFGGYVSYILLNNYVFNPQQHTCLAINDRNVHECGIAAKLPGHDNPYCTTNCPGGGGGGGGVNPTPNVGFSLGGLAGFGSAASTGTGTNTDPHQNQQLMQDILDALGWIALSGNSGPDCRPPPQTYRNEEGFLPKQSDPTYYTEYDLYASMVSLERIILGKAGEVLYTPTTHPCKPGYGSFTRIR